MAHAIRAHHRLHGSVLRAVLGSLDAVDPEEVNERHPCERCGLPVGGDDAYCCYGCELAARIQAESEGEGGSTRAGLVMAAFLTMNLMMFTLVLYGDDVYGAGWDRLRSLFRVGAWAMATPVYAILGVPLTRSALGALRKRRIVSELPVVA